jgi:hypothetical protein
VQPPGVAEQHALALAEPERLRVEGDRGLQQRNSVSGVRREPREFINPEPDLYPSSARLLKDCGEAPA